MPILLENPQATPVIPILMHVLHYSEHNATSAIKTTADTSAFPPEKRMQKLCLHFNAISAIKMIIELRRFHLETLMQRLFFLL